MRTRMLCTAVAFLGLASAVPAQSAKEPPTAPAPIPSEITVAKKVFISNGGGDDLQDVSDFVIVKGGSDRVYDQLFAAMKSWGRYDLTSSPADADLVLEISFRLSDSGLEHLASQSSLSAIPVMGQIHLVILDPKMRVTLWTITEYVQGAILESNREKNFNTAMDRVVDRLKKLVEPPPAPTQ